MSPDFDSWGVNSKRYGIFLHTLSFFLDNSLDFAMPMSSEIAGAIEDDQNVFETATGQQELTLSQRMLSACTGSLLTSMVVTPFDVVRIRMQQQELLYPVGVASDCCRKVFWEARNANYCESGTCVEQHNTANRINGTFSGIMKISAQEGVGTLYRGLGLTLLMAIPANVVYFSGYEFMRDSSPLAQSYPILNPLICGSLARTLAGAAVAPLELIKTRVQAVPSTSTKSSRDIFRMVVKNCYQDFKLNGPSSLFKGFGLTLWRDVPFSGIYWATYEYLAHELKSFELFNDEKSDDPSKLFMRSFLSGSMAGITAAVFTNPFDVGKTRLQVSFEDTNTLGTLAKAAEKENMFKFMASIYRQEGIGALYVGLLPRCMKIAPACAIMISTYELSKRFFIYN